MPVDIIVRIISLTILVVDICLFNMLFGNLFTLKRKIAYKYIGFAVLIVAAQSITLIDDKIIGGIIYCATAATIVIYLYAGKWWQQVVGAAVFTLSLSLSAYDVIALWEIFGASRDFVEASIDTVAPALTAKLTLFLLIRSVLSMVRWRTERQTGAPALKDFA